jgi:hypothetical protein
MAADRHGSWHETSARLIGANRGISTILTASPAQGAMSIGPLERIAAALRDKAPGSQACPHAGGLWWRAQRAKGRSAGFSSSGGGRFRQISAVFSQSAYCFSAAMICSSVCPFFGISNLFVSGEPQLPTISPISVCTTFGFWLRGLSNAGLSMGDPLLLRQAFSS